VASYGAQELDVAVSVAGLTPERRTEASSSAAAEVATDLTFMGDRSNCSSPPAWRQYAWVCKETEEARVQPSQ